jgi:hypothetical protein
MQVDGPHGRWPTGEQLIFDRTGDLHHKAGDMTPRSQPDWAMLSFIAGLAVLAFIFGVVTAKLGTFPSGSVGYAIDAVRDWRDNWRHYLQIRSKYAVDTHRSGGVTASDPAAAYPGYTFITGFRDGQFQAFLLGMKGTIEHEWKVAFSEVWPDPTHLDFSTADFDISLHGAALLPDGAVVMSFEGLGTVKLDRCSRILWRVPAETHHSVDALPTGEFLIPARHRLTKPRPDLPGVRVAAKGWVREDLILHLASEGWIVRQTSVLERMLTSGLESVLYANGQDAPELGRTTDPLHLNDAEMLREDMASVFPLFVAGDILISLRQLNTIAVLDGRTFLFKWSMTGPFLRQHDPDFLPNGHILLLDNRRGGDAKIFGNSRVLEIDPVSRQVVWSYAGSEREPFYTEIRGKLQQLPNGNILVTEAEAGRVFELARDPHGGRIVWEWVNGLGDGLAGVVTQADRVAADKVGFLGQSCS